ncbi:AraC family transcriptional regulator ligand-binding domain-containing protein [Pelomonas sp. KK5]|uniref:AraC family transcriptional regulator ligand-binding domain-containing protein n=1 Tax=Pelomonas sp. KK5 TaxID=1855730 RepID=UPI00097BDC47|nr:AraC family transcriptional regulator ligand-binding domain-containing protein [Pelomonas sp. KK5]
MLPFSGVLALALEQDWQERQLFFPSFSGAATSTQPYCSYVEAREGLQLALRHHEGLELAVLSGARKSLPHLGALGLGMMSHATVGEALTFGMRYQLVAGSMLQFRTEADGDEASMTAHLLFDDPELAPFLAIDHMATALNSLRQILAPLPVSRLLKRVELAFEAPALASSLAALFETTVVFGADRSRLVFDARALSLRLMFHNAVSAEVAREACERELAARWAERESTGASLRQRLFGADGRLLPLPAVASSMGLSLRSLHRALAREGIRYSDLYEQLGRQRAEKLLLAGASTSTIAETLQFSDQRSFVRAFERWTGMSPAAWRRQNAAPQAVAVIERG